MTVSKSIVTPHRDGPIVEFAVLQGYAAPLDSTHWPLSAVNRVHNIKPPDFNPSGYIHDICLELGSIRYICVWHGIGYCWKSLRYSPIPVQGGSRKNPDLFGGWRDGSWIEAMKKKETFSNNPFEVLSL